MKIVEYDHKYAALVADMWNKSNASWGNDDELKTKEDVIASESNSDNIKLYLAIDQEQVVGYCSFSEYKQDEGASYLPLLNVRPDYHGKKVGKALILKVLEDAIHSKWSRFDLYTWSGNIKAMPLYKKCGFFWERKNDTVHLMNFIPYLYQTEALKDYLDQIDWYNDNKRQIDMLQDGEERNGFDYYTYTFKNDSTFLNVEFERTSRGLTYIDTPQYSVRLVLDNHKLVYENTYQARLEIINKTEESLHIKVKGQNNKNIKIDYDIEQVVHKEETLKIPFTVEKTQAEQDLGKTHPSVDLLVYINNKLANFKCGVLPKKPLAIDFVVTDFIHRKNESYIGYLNLENNLGHKESFHLDLPSTLIKPTKDLHVTLEKDEKKSIQVEYEVNDFGFYHEDIVINYQGIQHTSEIKTIIKGSNETFHCDFDHDYFLVSGNYIVIFNKKSNNVRMIDRFYGPTITSFMPAKLGLPFSPEFNNTKAKISQVSANQMIISYESESFKGITLHVHVKNNYGFIEVYYEISNHSDKQEISLSIPVHKPMRDSYIPYKNRLLKTDEDAWVNNIEFVHIDQNWIYNYKERQGFIWPKDAKMTISNWHLSFNYDKIKLDKFETFKTSMFIVTYVHPSLKEFKKLALDLKEKDTFGFYEFLINDGNPILKNDAKLSLINHKKAHTVGKIQCDQKEIGLDQTMTIQEGLKTIKLDLQDRSFEETRILLKPSGNVVTSLENEIYTIDNGVISFKADSKYADSIISLKHNGIEWLDSNYPEPKERAWWGGFIGGINQRVQGIQDIAAIKEERDVNFVQLDDNFANQWTGIRITTKYGIDPGLKGITTEMYVLTLPGLPLLHVFTKFTNRSGKMIIQKNAFRFNTLNLQGTKDKAFFKKGDTTFKVGDHSTDVELKKILVLESERNHNFVLYNKKNEILFDSQKDYVIVFSEGQITIPDGETEIFTGDFIYFTKDKPKSDSFKLFDNITFEV